MVDTVNPLFAANELVDIEPLIAPGIDWFFWLETSFLILAGLLTFLFVLYFVRFLYRPVLFKWQLTRLQKQASAHQQMISKAEVAKLYVWLSHYQAWLNHSQSSVKQADNFKAALSDLHERVNKGCFSDHAVSRETYLNLMSAAQLLVKQGAQFSTPFAPLKALRLRFKSLKNRAARWKR